MKLPGPQPFRTIVMAAVAVVTTPFFVAIIVATRQVVGVSSPGDIVVGDSGRVIGVYDSASKWILHGRLA